MKLTKAKIKNFRLLKDLTLNFSADEKRPLTVIRAANETGKTTCEHALMWGLYGSKVALPNKGVYSLFPLDMHQDHKRVEVSVEIEFEADEISSMGRGEQIVKRTSYRLKRSCVEVSLNKENSAREREVIEVHRLTSAGTVPLAELEANSVIENALPKDLKDVYFTDGDAAMSFIEAAAATGVKRKRVSSAIQSLLGLDNLSNIQRHLERVAEVLSGQLDTTDYNDKFTALKDQIGGHNDDIAEWEAEISESQRLIAVGERTEKTTRRQIDELLKTGDREALVVQRNGKEKDLEKYKKNASFRLKALSILLTDQLASSILTNDSFKKGHAILNGMAKKKILPRTNVPLLEEILDRESCHCGADLKGETDESKKRRDSIEQEINDSKKSDEVTQVATELWYKIRSKSTDTAGASWLSSYEQAQEEYQSLVTLEAQAEAELDRIKQTEGSIKDANLNELRLLEESTVNKLNGERSEVHQRLAWIKDSKSRLEVAIKDRDKIEKRLDKTDTGAHKLAVARKMQKLFVNIVNKLKQEEVKKVSYHMNRVFLNMIGSDPDKNDKTLITRAELTDDYDIRVFGPNNIEMNPDQDLNGASRRAITLAFIIALTKVSQVEAPNIIDTPLGMTSGYVKQSILTEILNEGSQIVLFLTHDEIKGVETIIDRYAGEIFTLTNPAHYPRMLANEPQDTEFSVIRCDCDHKRTCAICERIEMGSA